MNAWFHFKDIHYYESIEELVDAENGKTKK
jgi:hypothetical protein